MTFCYNFLLPLCYIFHKMLVDDFCLLLKLIHWKTFIINNNEKHTAKDNTTHSGAVALFQ